MMWNRKNSQWLAACAVGLLAATPAHALIISKSNMNQVVVGSQDAGTDTRSIFFDVGDFSGADNVVQNLTVDIDFIKCGGSGSLSIPLPLQDCPNQASMAFVNEIGFSLTDPSGTMIYLVYPSTLGSSYSNTSTGGRISVTFDDSASPDVGYSTPSFMGGTFHPAEYLSDLIQKSATGEWILGITNAGAGAPLGVASFTVNVEVNEAPPPVPTAPEPGATVLMILGLAGIMSFTRRFS